MNIPHIITDVICTTSFQVPFIQWNNGPISQPNNCVMRSCYFYSHGRSWFWNLWGQLCPLTPRFQVTTACLQPSLLPTTPVDRWKVGQINTLVLNLSWQLCLETFCLLWPCFFLVWSQEQSLELVYFSRGPWTWAIIKECPLSSIAQVP